MNFPNAITLFRIVLVPFFFTELLSYRSGEERHRWIAFAIFFAASLSDALDGILARAMKKQSSLGQFLDPLADKLLLLSGFLGILFVDTLRFRPPLWITVTIVFRDLVILAGILTLFLMGKEVRIRPNMVGKATTAFQMITLISILLATELAVPCWYITAALTIISCIWYVGRELRRFGSE